MRVGLLWVAGVCGVKVLGDNITVVVKSNRIQKIITDSPPVVASTRARAGGGSPGSAPAGQRQNLLSAKNLPPSNQPSQVPPDACTVVRLRAPLSDQQERLLRSKLAASNSYLAAVYRRVIHGLAVCSRQPNVVEAVVMGIPGISVDLAETNKLYHLSYKQEGLPDNFYTILNNQKVLFNLPPVDRAVNRYIRNGYLMRNSVLFKWYRNRYLTLSSIETAKGVTLFVIDGNINQLHQEVTGRVTVLKDAHVPPDQHATSVVTAAAGTTTGLAKEAQVVVYPVFRSGMAYLSDILTALEALEPQMVHQKSVLLLPFSGDPSLILDDAMRYLFEHNLPVVVAAGNNRGSSCSFSPGRSKYVVTVGALADSLAPAAWSNTGGCVDTYAPGTATVGADRPGEKPKYLTQEGTSLSAAYTAGYIATLIQNKTITPANLKKFFVAASGEIPVTPLPQDSSLYPVIKGSFSSSNLAYDLLFVAALLLLIAAIVLLLRRQQTVYVRYQPRK